MPDDPKIRPGPAAPQGRRRSYRLGEVVQPGSPLQLAVRRSTFLRTVTKLTRGEILDSLAAVARGELDLAGWQEQWRLYDAWAAEAAARTIEGAARFAARFWRVSDLAGLEPKKLRDALRLCWPALAKFDQWHDEASGEEYVPMVPTSLLGEEARRDEARRNEIRAVYGALMLTGIRPDGGPEFALVEQLPPRFETNCYCWKWWALIETRAVAEARLRYEVSRLLTSLGKPPTRAARLEIAASVRRYLDDVERRAEAAGWQRNHGRRTRGGRAADRAYEWLARWQVLGHSDTAIALAARVSADAVVKARRALAREIGLTPRSAAGS